jgi:hypothetical protein
MSGMLLATIPTAKQSPIHPRLVSQTEFENCCATSNEKSMQKRQALPSIFQLHHSGALPVVADLLHSLKLHLEYDCHHPVSPSLPLTLASQCMPGQPIPKCQAIIVIKQANSKSSNSNTLSFRA